MKNTPQQLPTEFGLSFGLSLDAINRLKTKESKHDFFKTKKCKSNIREATNVQLKQHIGATIAMMRLSDTFDVSKEKMNHLSPVCAETLSFKFEDDIDLQEVIGL